MELKMKIISIVGVRPQLIKEAVLRSEIEKHPEIEYSWIHTGQHYDVSMSKSFELELNLPNPDYQLNINNLSNITSVASMMLKMEPILIEAKPDFVIVHGDTNSTLAGALCAKKINIPLIHIEAGIRQHPKSMPEEINRVLVDHMSSLLFTPSLIANKNLENEGIIKGVHFVGDIMLDLFKKNEKLFNDEIINRLNLTPNNYILFTLHRDFNVDIKSKLETILFKMSEVAKKFQIVFPVHPRTLKMIHKFDLSGYLKNFINIDPIGYLDLMSLTKQCYKVVTDSGGYQKEAFYSKRQACVIMEDTGWRELIDLDYNILLDPFDEDFVNKILKKTTIKKYEGVYGSGNTAKKIVEQIKLYAR